MGSSGFKASQMGMRTLCFAVLLAGASADLLEYNYYAELADSVMKMEATASATSSLAQVLSRAETFTFDVVGAGFEVLVLEFAEAAFDVIVYTITGSDSNGKKLRPPCH